MRKLDTYEETEADSVRITAAEDEDRWESYLNTFQPANRLTGACQVTLMHRTNL